ncbi:MAG: 1-acyl-sn-glycerol-3-phosphate acyltransferase [Pseudomonadota bacterium]
MPRLIAPLPEDQAHGKHIVDLLIEERAKHLRDNPLVWPLIRAFIYPILQYGRAVAMADTVRNKTGADVMDYVRDLLTLDLDVRGADHIPREGPCVVVANHPTGIVDGIAVWEALRRVRPDVVFFANRDAIRVSPGLADIIIPVEWEMDKRSHTRSRETLRAAAAAFQAGKLVVLFPSGRLSEMTDRGLREQDWLPTAIPFSRKYNAPVLPLHIGGRNSRLYYFLCKTSKELRDMTLFHEIMNKKRYPYRLTFGAPIPPDRLEGTPAHATERVKAFVENELVHGPRALPTG